VHIPLGRDRDMRSSLMAVATGLPLLATALDPPIAISILLWFVSGFFAAYQVDVITSIVQGTPEAVRSRVSGVVGAGLTGAQGIGVIIFGAIAEATRPGRSIALAAALGSAIALIITVLSARKDRLANPARHRAG
jgi:predicted MFS family arabinose efflux permease